MKSAVMQEIILSKLKNGEMPTKISRDLNGKVSIRTIKRWSRQLRQVGFVQLHASTGRKRTIRTRETIQKAKRFLKTKASRSVRKLARKLGTSYGTARNILKHDLGCKPYKVVKVPKLSEAQKRSRVKFSNWLRHKFAKNDTLNFVFSDEKLFAVDGVFNRQNERVWAVSRRAADEGGAIRPVSKFPGKIMVANLRTQVIVDSCSKFYTRVRRVGNNGGEYIR